MENQLVVMFLQQQHSNKLAPVSSCMQFPSSVSKKDKIYIFFLLISLVSSTGSCVTIGHRSYIGANGVNYEAQWGMQTSDTSRGVREAKQHFSKAVKFIGAGGGTGGY